MATTIDQSIIERIQKCLTLANDHGATEGEATAAMAMAQKLLVKYNLSMLDVAGGLKRQGEVVENRVETNNPAWKNSLAGVLARNNFCRCIIGRHQVYFIGRPENVGAVSEMYQWVQAQIVRIATTEASRVRKERGLTFGEQLNWRNSFCMGVVSRINERLEAARQEQEREDNRVTSLVVCYEAENAEFVTKRYPRLGIARGVNVRSGDGYSAGRSAGDRVSLTPSSRQVK